MTSDAWSRPFAILLMAFALTHGLYQVGRAWFHPKQGLDFAPEYVAARMFLQERNLQFYDYPNVAASGRRLGLHGPLGPQDPIINYAYPPWLPVFYAPFSLLPWTAARRVWFALSLLASLGGAALCGAAVAPTEKLRRPYAAAGFASLCFFFPAAYGLMAGQANDVLLLALAASLYLLRKGRPYLAGLALAPAAMWKIFPGFPAFFFLARRDWRALAGLAVGCAGIFLVSLPLVGFKTWLDWVSYVRGPYTTLTEGWFRNHSIAAAAIFLFKPNSAAPPLVDAPELASYLTLAVQGLAVVATIFCLLPAAKGEDTIYAVQFASTLVLAVLLTPRSWEHYGIFLIPAFLACFEACRQRGPKAGAVPLALLGTCFAIWGLFFQLREEYEALAAVSLALFLPLKTFASLALLGLCTWLTWTQSTRSGTALRSGLPSPSR